MLVFRHSIRGTWSELIVDTVVQLQGTLSERDEVYSLRAIDLRAPSMETDDARPVIIQVSIHALQRRCMEQLAAALASHPGYCVVKLAIVRGNGDVTLMTFGDRFRVRRESGLFSDVKVLFGADAILEGQVDKW